VTVEVRTEHAAYPHWQLPVTLTFRRGPGGWRAVGLERAVRPRPS
jgi:hypothetical protein